MPLSNLPSSRQGDDALRARLRFRARQPKSSLGICIFGLPTLIVNDKGCCRSQRVSGNRHRGSVCIVGEPETEIKIRMPSGEVQDISLKAITRSDGAAVEEGVALVDERGWIRKDDGDGIEADLVPGDAGASGVGAGGAHDILLLIAVDGALGTGNAIRGAGFDFDENDGVPIARDDVDLGIAFVGPIVAGDYHQAGAAQIAMSEVFAAASEGGIGCKCAAFAEVARGVAQFPEELPGVDVTVRSFSTSRCHSMTLPRTR